MILVSACLLGHNVKYSGGNNYCELLARSQYVSLLLPICPECSGQLPIPRPPCEITGGCGSDVLLGRARVCCKNGVDVTANFISGAQKVLALAQTAQITAAILKARSPSCGSGQIYNGNFDGTLISGDGVTTALLKQHGIAVYTELELTEALLATLLNQ